MRQQAAAHSAEQARILERRLQTDMTLARVSYRGVEDSTWWATAGPEDVFVAYRDAAAWRDVDPDAAQAYQRISHEVRDGYGIDINTIAPASLSSHLAEVATELEQKSTLHIAEATALLAAAERSDRAAASPDAAAAGVGLDVQPAPASAQGHSLRAAADVEYDSADRRADTARELTAVTFDASAIEAKMVADLAQARSVTEANRAPGGPPKARKNHPKTAASRERGMSR